MTAVLPLEPKSRSAPPAPAGRKVVYALALFDEVETLAAAARDLTQSGVLPARMSLLVSEPRAPAILAELGDRDLLARIAVADSLQGLVESDDLTNSVRGLFGGRTRAGSLADAADARLPWLLDRQTKAIDHHLRRGGSILMVHLDTPDEQIAICAALLARSPRGVQTHEVRQPL